MPIECPCCHGKKRLACVEHHDDGSVLTWPICCHCMGEGVIDDADEVQEPDSAAVFWQAG